MRHEELRLDNQLCFPLYSAARAVVRAYKPYLDGIGLTYTQYITMMALWEHAPLTVNELGGLLYLDSGTLTPLLKKLEQKGLVTRTRSTRDSRRVLVGLTGQGTALEDEAAAIPHQMERELSLPREDALELYRILHEFLGDRPAPGQEPGCSRQDS